MNTFENRLTTITLTDQLVYRCRQGDVRAYRELYDAYSKAMYNICLRMIGNTGDAEDILQEAFLQVFNNIGKIQQESSLSGWIKRIVVNQCLSYLRKKKVYFEEVGDDHVEEAAAVDEQAFALTVTMVKDAIQQLPSGYRTVLNLYLFEDYSHREIGDMLGITESTAKTQYMRAKEKVRQIVKQKTTA